jgi:hypothetical protein
MPPDLYDLLKGSADRNRRSMNQEAIVQLERSLVREPTANKAGVMDRIRERRAQLGRAGIWVTDDFINRAKNEGRR